MKNFLITSLTAIALFTFGACSDVDLENNLNTQKELNAKSINEQPYIEGDASQQEEANEKLTKILKSFGTTFNHLKREIPNYPDYYGGGYITENGSLVVYIHGDVSKGQEKLSTIIGGGNVEFKKADYSYAHLTSIMDQLNEVLSREKGSALLDNLTSYALMDRDNRIVVELLNLNETSISTVKKLSSNSSALVFKQSQGKLKLEVNLNPGCGEVYTISPPSAGSFGFRARRISDSRVGMVTSGHVIGLGLNTYYNGSIIGVCSASQESGTIDAAFIPISNLASFTPTNTLCGTSNTLSTTTSQPGVGTTINKIGVETNATSGTILSTNASVPSGGIIISNLTSANYLSADGDSGGIVYSYLSSTGVRPTVGIHMGVIGSTRYFCKADEVLSTFGLTRY